MSRRHLLTLYLSLCLSFLFFLPNAHALGGKQPSLNEPAPEFTLPTNTGDGEIALSDYKGKWVVLYFYPEDFTGARFGMTPENTQFSGY